MTPYRAVIRRQLRALLLVGAGWAVAHHGAADLSAGQTDSLPRGHYLSFARERDLQHELLLRTSDRLAATQWQQQVAGDLRNALTTPGVRGFSVRVDWRTFETADAEFDWRLMDANMSAARELGLKLIVHLGTRSFDGEPVTPAYFPDRYVTPTHGNGHTGYVARVWDPWVRDRLIRAHQQIAARYADDPTFGGLATSESAVGNLSDGSGYSLPAYQEALVRIVSETRRALGEDGKLFWYVNFLRDGPKHGNMRLDPRAAMVSAAAHPAIVVGAPDIAPDLRGMPGSVTSLRIHLRKTQPELAQFCHAQHLDQGLGGRNRKSNRYRQALLERTQRVREYSTEGPRQASPQFEPDELPGPDGRTRALHPESDLDQLWTPAELFAYARHNFGCEYFFWHYRAFPRKGEFGWPDVRPIIVANPELAR